MHFVFKTLRVSLEAYTHVYWKSWLLNLFLFYFPNARTHLQTKLQLICWWILHYCSCPDWPSNAWGSGCLNWKDPSLSHKSVVLRILEWAVKLLWLLWDLKPLPHRARSFAPVLDTSAPQPDRNCVSLKSDCSEFGIHLSTSECSTVSSDIFVRLETHNNFIIHQGVSRVMSILNSSFHGRTFMSINIIYAPFF